MAQLSLFQEEIAIVQEQDPELTTNEMSQPCDLNFFCNGNIKAPESLIKTINDVKGTN